MRAAQLSALHCEANSLKEWWKAPPPKGAGRAISDLLDLLADVNGDALRAAVMEGTPLQGDSRIYHSAKGLISDSISRYGSVESLPRVGARPSAGIGGLDEAQEILGEAARESLGYRASAIVPGDMLRDELPFLVCSLGLAAGLEVMGGAVRVFERYGNILQKSTQAAAACAAMSWAAANVLDRDTSCVWRAQARSRHQGVWEEAMDLVNQLSMAGF